MDSDSDAINLNGDPGSTGGVQRGCLEDGGATVLCQVNIDFTNTGTISTARDNGSNAGIRIEDDIIVNGVINNESSGTIIGARNGIFVNGAHSDHSLAINNSGAITGTSDTGIVITGAGVSLTNQVGGTITGGDVGLQISDTTIDIDVGATDVEDVAVLATRNSFVNAGTISGGDAAVDASDASTAFVFTQQGGGSLDGDFIGSQGIDTFNVAEGTGAFILSNDIRSNVNVNVTQDATLGFAGEGTRSIDGDLNSDGTLEFVLNAPGSAPLASVTGDVTLNSGSTVSVDVNNQVTAAGQQFTLIELDDGSTLTNESTLTTNLEETNFFLDLVAVTSTDNNDLVIESIAAGSDPVGSDPTDSDPAGSDPAGSDPAGSDPADSDPVASGQDGSDSDTVDSLGSTVNDTSLAGIVSGTDESGNSNFDSILSLLQDANENGQLSLTQGVLGAIATQLDASTEGGQAAISEAVAGLLPDLSNSSSQELFESLSALNNVIGQRLSSFTNSANSTAGRAPTSFSPAVYVAKQNQAAALQVQNEKKASFSTVSSGIWVQTSLYNSEQDDDISIASLDQSYDADTQSFSVGYDFTVDDNTLIGFSGSYSDIEINQFRSARDETEIDAIQLSAYGLRQFGKFQVNGQLSYIDGSADTRRTVLGNGITANFGLDGFSAQLETNYTYKLGQNAYFTPLVSLQYADISQDSFTETGGLNLNVGASNNDYLEGRLGFKLGGQIVKPSSATDLFFSAALVSDFSSSSDEINISFATQSTGLTVFDADDERVELGAGVNWYSSKNYSLGASINGEVSDDFYTVGGRVQFKYNF